MSAPEAESLRTSTSRGTTGTGQLPVIAVVAVGGGIGAAARYAAALAWPMPTGGFPWTTFWVNAMRLRGHRCLPGADHRGADRAPAGAPFFGTGVLGGFTTFSTYAVDIQRLLDAGRPGTAFAYLAATLCAALGGVWAAATTTRRLLGRRPR